MELNWISIWKCAYKWQLAITPLLSLVLCLDFASYPAAIGKHCPALTFLNMQGKLNSIDNAPRLNMHKASEKWSFLPNLSIYNSSVPRTQCVCFFLREWETAVGFIVCYTSPPLINHIPALESTILLGGSISGNFCILCCAKLYNNFKCTVHPRTWAVDGQ